jgi:uncharacterized protein YndB with AHSA1/START domain
MKLSTRASVEVSRPPEAVFDVATDPARIPGLMKKLGPIPGVLGIDPETGSTRAVRMSDGSTMREEVTVADRPRDYRYRWLNPPKAPFSLLVRGGAADWSFRPNRGGTTVDWTYTFELTTPLVYPLAAPVILLFNRWMRAALAELARAA